MSRKLILQQIKHIIDQQELPVQTNVYLFGSWARNQIKHTSDIDIAFEFAKPEPSQRTIVRIIRDALEESSIPYRIDVVDFKDMEIGMQQQVKKEGILWTDWHNV